MALTDAAIFSGVPSARALVAFTLALLVSGACESYTEVRGPTPYLATLAGANVRPASVTTNGQGTLTASVDPQHQAFSYTLSWSGLGSAATGAHLHGPATTSEAGDVLVDFAALPAGSTGTLDLGAGEATGRLVLTGAITATVSGDSLRTLLNAGQVYVDVHTLTLTGGEIRGQLARR